MALPAADRQDMAALTLPADEGRAFFEREAWRLAGMSGAEFLRRWASGEFKHLDDVPENWDIFRLALLIPFAQQES